MKKILIVLAVPAGLIILTLVLLLILKPRQPGASRRISTEAELDLYLEQITENATPPSLSLTVLKGDKLTYSKAFGMADAPLSRPARTSTVYPWYSVTKLFTSAAILKLADEGKLSLSDPVKKYIPDYNTVNKEGEGVSITIDQLLNHESGLPDIIPEGLNWIHSSREAPPNQTDFFNQKMIEEYRVVEFTPGSRVRYSNTGFIVLGVIIEKITGTAYENYIEETILKPLSMEKTGFSGTSGMEQHLATGSQHRINAFTPLLMIYGKRGFMKQLVRETEDHRMWFMPVNTDYSPSTGLNGTSEDLARFGYALMTSRRLEDGTAIGIESIAGMQKPYTMKELERRYSRIKQYGYGLKAWKMKGYRIYGHSGGGPGFAALLAFVPERNLVVAVSANDTSLDRMEILETVMKMDW
ncbi:MAG: serine hydrolase [Spirochaetales bacterium]|nr:serine hydrolase [Spirochaetales bacterium]